MDDVSRDSLFTAVRWRLLFARSPNFVAVLEGPEHRFVYANRRFLELVGRDDVVTRSVAEALPDAVSQGHVELLDRVHQNGEALTEEGAPYAPVDMHGNERDRYGDFVYQPLFDDAGNVRGILVE
jgi:PAS domain-containing protein